LFKVARLFKHPKKREFFELTKKKLSAGLDDLVAPPNGSFHL
jgi:hypothetical protein